MGGSTSTAKDARPRKATKDHLRKRSRASTSVVLYTDDKSARAVVDLERTMAQLRMLHEAGSPEVTKLREELEEARAERDKHAVTIRFETIGRKRYAKLVDDNPPTEAQTAEFQEHQAKAREKLAAGEGNPDEIMDDEVPAYNPETFPLALIHATMVSPTFESVEELEEVLDEWSEAEFMQLWMAAMSVCAASRVGYWGKG